MSVHMSDRKVLFQLGNNITTKHRSAYPDPPLSELYDCSDLADIEG